MLYRDFKKLVSPDKTANLSDCNPFVIKQLQG